MVSELKQVITFFMFDVPSVSQLNYNSKLWALWKHASEGLEIGIVPYAKRISMDFRDTVPSATNGSF